MTGYLLDRDVLGQLDLTDDRQHVNVRAWLRTVPDDELYVSVLTIHEAWRGFGLERRRAKGDENVLEKVRLWEDDFTDFIATFDGRVIPVDPNVARLWGALRGEVDKHVFDLGIVATAINSGLVVATRNLKHFRGRGARLIDPFKASPTIE